MCFDSSNILPWNITKKNFFHCSKRIEMFPAFESLCGDGGRRYFIWDFTSMMVSPILIRSDGGFCRDRCIVSILVLWSTTYKDARYRPSYAEWSSLSRLRVLGTNITREAHQVDAVGETLGKIWKKLQFCFLLRT